MGSVAKKDWIEGGCGWGRLRQRENEIECGLLGDDGKEWRMVGVGWDEHGYKGMGSRQFEENGMKMVG